jgi:hypothetical protein
VEYLGRCFAVFFLCIIILQVFPFFRYILDVGDKSFPSPENGIPFIAPFANEPALDEEENCIFVGEPLDDEDDTVNSYRRFGLRTRIGVKCGEELLWDYGKGYGCRSYPSKHN